MGGLRPPFLVLRTPMRSIGYGAMSAFTRLRLGTHPLRGRGQSRCRRSTYLSSSYSECSVRTASSV
jgi:hypothetical protein